MINPDMNSGGGSRSSSDIESDIRRTRNRMDSTLDQLGDRLTARSVLHTILDIWESRQPSTPQGEVRSRRVYGALTRQVGHQIRENPIPTLLIGAGLAWMFMDREHDHTEREYVEMSGRRYRVRPAEIPGQPGMAGGVPVTEYEYEEVDYEDINHGPGMMEKAKQKLAEGKEAISNAASAAKEKLSDLGATAREKVRDVRDVTHDQADHLGHRAHSAADRLRYRARSGEARVRAELRSGYAAGAEQFRGAVDEMPLGVGLGFAALGAIVGLLIPHTRREDELMGERSDELLDTVKERARDTFEKGKHVAERVAETALDEAQKHGLTAETARQKLSDLAGTAGDIARKVKDEAATAAREENLVPAGAMGQSQEQSMTGPQVSSSGPLTGMTPMPSGVVEEGESVNMPPKGASTQPPF